MGVPPFFFLILFQYPEDRSLLGRKAQKAAKEIAEKQSAGKSEDFLAQTRDVIVPLRKDPQMLDVVLQVLPEEGVTKKELFSKKGIAEEGKEEAPNLRSHDEEEEDIQVLETITVEQTGEEEEEESK